MPNKVVKMKKSYNAIDFITDANKQIALDIINTAKKIDMTEDAIELVARRFGFRAEIIRDWYHKMSEG